MASFNKVFLIGNLTRDPETKQVGSSQVCNFGLAVNRKYNDKQTGEKKEEVSFFDLECWGRTAELAQQYLKKGRPIFMEGRLKQDRWETEDGKKMSRIKIQVDNIQFLGSKEDGAAQGAPASGAPLEDDIPF
jgi:single-strand DNA-binding protein